MLRKEFPDLHRLSSLWTRSYFVSAAAKVSQEVSQEATQRYIAAQSTS
jgi:putative transposase